jgi:hypothetical protein
MTRIKGQTAQQRIENGLKRLSESNTYISVEQFRRDCQVALATLNNYPELRDRFNLWQKSTVRKRKANPAMLDIRKELAKGKTYRTVAEFCLAAGRTLRALTQYPDEHHEVRRRVANHSLETDSGYSFNHPNAIEERILEALEDGPLELMDMIDLLKFSGISHGSLYNYRQALDRLLSSNPSLYRYKRTLKSRRTLVFYSLEKLHRVPWDWEIETELLTRNRKKATVKPTAKPAPPPVEEMLIEEGKIVGKIVKYHDQPPVTVRFAVPREMAG